jgi:hypothetical protein
VARRCAGPPSRPVGHQLLSWGVHFSTFPHTAPAITASEGWSPVVSSLGFSGALLVAGFAAPLVTTQLLRRGGRTVLTAGSVLGVLGMAAVAARPRSPGPGRRARASTNARIQRAASLTERRGPLSSGSGPPRSGGR